MYRGKHKALGGLECHCGQLFQNFHIKAECCQSLKGKEVTELWENWDFFR